MFVQGITDHPHRYLRRSVLGMVETSQKLMDLGMAFASDSPEFPDSSHLSAEDVSEEGTPVTEQARTYLAQLEETLSAHGGSGAGIPLHKFGSNDGWHATAAECAAAVQAYKQAISDGAAHPDEFADDVVPFLHTAAQCDGFRVY